MNLSMMLFFHFHALFHLMLIRNYVQGNVEYVLDVLQVIGSRHVILVLPAYEHGTLDLVKELNKKWISVEILIIWDKPFKNQESENITDHTKVQLDYRYLYDRSPLNRQDVLVLVNGPLPWCTDAAAKLLSVHMFGAWDRLLIVPENGTLSWANLRDHVAIGTNLAVIQDLLLQEALLSNGMLALKTIGKWNNETLNLYETPFKPLIYLEETNLTAVVGTGWDSLSAGFYTFKSGDHPMGLFGPIIREIWTSLKGNLHVQEVEAVLHRHSNGSWEGMIGSMERWEGDIAVFYFIVRQERAEGMDYANYLYFMEQQFMTHFPIKVEDPFMLIKIFPLKVWLGILGCLSVVIIALKFLWHIPWTHGNPTYKGHQARRSDECAMKLTLSAAVFQGSDRVPQSAAGKLLYGIFLLSVVVVLGYAYSGSLTAVLSAPTLTKVPHRLQEILDFGYRVWIQEGFAQHDIMKTSSSEVLQELLSKAEVSYEKSQLPPEEVIDRAHKTNIALMTTRPAAVLSKYADFGNGEGSMGAHGVCQMRKVEEPLYTTIIGFGLPRNSPLADLINKKILQLIAHDLIGATGVEGKLTIEGGLSVECLPPPALSLEPQPFQLHHVAGAFFLWITGIASATVIFILEKLFHKYYQRRPSTSPIHPL